MKKINHTRLARLLALVAVPILAGTTIVNAYPSYAPSATAKPVPVVPAKPGAPALDALIPAIEVEAVTFVAHREDEAGKPRPNDFWWPNLLNVSRLRRYEEVNPLGKDFNYAKAFAKLDLKEVRKDIRNIMHDSKPFWPADYGHYGPLFIRMAWHSAGTYRALDGRGGSDGGQQRFEPLNSWPDNANLDKARLLIQPLVDKYYPNLSWADAMILAGDEAMRDMGFQTLGVAGGRTDDWAPDLVYWGPEDKFLESHRFTKEGKLFPPLAASVMGLIYVNPEGPDGKPDPKLSAQHIRITFGNMGMNDEETVALIVGGHSFGKAHGAHPPEKCLTGPAPAGAGVEEGSTGWKNRCGKGNAEDSVTSGLEGSWSSDPIHWTQGYLKNLYKYEWKVQKGPGGKWQWYAENLEKADFAPNAHGPGRVPIMMLTPDVALKVDAAYRKISTRFLEKPEELRTAFSRAWFKLVHRDMGPKTRYLGTDYPKEDFLWQDPIPAVTHKLVDKKDVERLKADVLKSGLSRADLVKTAWAAAATYRGTDMKGGINGARLRLAPQKDWEVNEPKALAAHLEALEKIRAKFNADQGKGGKQLSLADLIVIAGNAAVEQAAEKGGVKLEVPFTPGRNDASQEQTELKSMEFLKVTNDGFRNYFAPKENYLNPANAFIDRADLLTLTVPEMTVLTGGLRALGANYGGTNYGVFTKNPGTLTNDFFVNLMDRSTVWTLADKEKGLFEGKHRETGAAQWMATTHDLIFGSNSELRVVAFTYANPNAKARFVHDFVRAWTKVMNLDRFDVK